MMNMRSKPQKDTHFRVRRRLQESPDMCQHEMALTTGVNYGGIRYDLHDLVDKGLVALGNFTAAEGRSLKANI